MPRYTPKGKPTKAEAAHMERIKQLGCVRCGQYGVDCHHITEAGRRFSSFHCLPLCKYHHEHIYELTSAEQMELCRELHEKHGWEFIEPPSKTVPRKLL